MTAPRTPDIERRIDALARRAGAMRLIEEVQATPDECIEKYNDQGVLIEWTMRAVRLEGPGWSVKDNSSDTKTVWHQFIAVLPEPEEWS